MIHPHPLTTVDGCGASSSSSPPVMMGQSRQQAAAAAVKCGFHRVIWLFRRRLAIPPCPEHVLFHLRSLPFCLCALSLIALPIAAHTHTHAHSACYYCLPTTSSTQLLLPLPTLPLSSPLIPSHPSLRRVHDPVISAARAVCRVTFTCPGHTFCSNILPSIHQPSSSNTINTYLPRLRCCCCCCFASCLAP